MYILRKIWAPEIFQGRYKKKDYFEGWYFKLISENRENVMAVIPGISLGKDLQSSHSFIQVIDGIHNKVDYFTYPLEAFHSHKSKFHITIGNNYFHSEGIGLNLDQNGTKIKGELFFKEIVRFPKTFLNPGIMGPYSFVPKMECYHGVVNMHQEIQGKLIRNHQDVDFTGGEGYVEKDWGTSFPENWIWVQANHFKDKGDSFMLSVATIPWRGKSFTGFLSFLKTGNQFYRFATYNGSKIMVLKKEEENFSVLIEGKNMQLEVKVLVSSGGILKAPKNGTMEREIEESISAEVSVILRNRARNILFKGFSANAGMELAGNTNLFVLPIEEAVKK